MKPLAVILLCLLLCSSFKESRHEFYLSVTEIEYKEESSTLEIISRVFIDDIETVLRKRYGKDFGLSKEQEKGEVEKYINKYISQKLQIQIDGNPVTLHYLGKEYEADQLLLFIEVENVPSFRQVTVTNSLLTDLFDDQKNIVHIIVQDEIRSLLLEKDRESGEVNFTE